MESSVATIESTWSPVRSAIATEPTTDPHQRECPDDGDDHADEPVRDEAGTQPEQPATQRERTPSIGCAGRDRCHAAQSATAGPVADRYARRVRHGVAPAPTALADSWHTSHRGRVVSWSSSNRPRSEHPIPLTNHVVTGSQGLGRTRASNDPMPCVPLTPVLECQSSGPVRVLARHALGGPRGGAEPGRRGRPCDWPRT